ncbi:MAG: di-heme oxidoredictase family protein [Planctomycetota bacterium]|jgi:cytochrome c551/c552
MTSGARGRNSCRIVLLTTAVGAAAHLGAPAQADHPVPQPKMGAPLNGLSPEQLDLFWAGRQDYDTQLLAEEGLGPVFNKESCANCHNQAGIVGGPGAQMVTRFGLAGKGGFDPLSNLGGPLLQQASISLDCAESIPPMANTQTFRLTPGVMGYGLVEAIPDSQILAVRDAQPEARRGTAHMVVPFETPGEERVGRFGWKAQVATVLTFSADAALNELGLTNRFLTEDNDPNGTDPPGNGDPDFCDEVPDPEDGPDGDGLHFIDRITAFQRYLAQAPQTPRSGMTGEAIFEQIGCAVCHTPSFTTADDDALEPAIRNQTVRPYSDFLLHDMGQAADFFPEGIHGGQLMRTAPLAGLRFRDPLWHDGRFGGGIFEDRVTGAINEHGALGSQGAEAQAGFAGLSVPDREALFAFLDSLGRIEFDADGDNDVDIEDFIGFDGAAGFEGCFGGGPYTPNDPCAVHDIDQDGDVDFDDFDVMSTVYEDELTDCNENGVFDLEDVLAGTSQDINGNAVPDDCEGCLADVDGSGAVDVDDLVEVILAWGPCGGDCPADIDASGAVDVDDLIAVILGWGGDCS